MKEFHVIIRNLAPHPHAGAIQTLVKGMTSYIENFTQTFDDFFTQSQRGPPFDPTMIVIIQDTMSRISEQVKGLHLLHALALAMFENMQTTNSSDLDHQGPPPQTQDDSSDSGHQEQSPNLHQNSVHAPIQEISWYNIPGITEELEHTSNYEGEQTRAPIQEVSWYAVLGVPENKNRSITTRPNSYPPMPPGQHIECLQKEMQCKSKCIKTERLGQDMVKSQLPDLNKTNSKGHSTHKSMKKKRSAQHKTKFMRHGQNTVQYKSPQLPKTKFRAQPQKVKINQKPNKKKKSNTNQILMARLSDLKIPDHSLTSNASSFTDILHLPFKLMPNKPRFKTRYK